MQRRAGERPSMPSVVEDAVTDGTIEADGVNYFTINQNIMNHGCSIGSVGGISMDAGASQGLFAHTERAVEAAVAMSDALHES